MNAFKNRTYIPLGYMGKKTANHISDKALVSRIYKQFNNMKTTQFKTGKGSERTFLHKRYKNNQ